MFLNLLEKFWGCKHKTLSFPQSPAIGKKIPEAASATGTYVVCLECGKELGYSWARMEIEK